MPPANARDLLAESLVGNERSRVVLFQTYFQRNQSIQPYGSLYSNVDEFLHDSFMNLLRRGHSFGAEERLETIVNSIALWTAVERIRTRSSPAGSGDLIRMCAPIEAEEPGGTAAFSPLPGDGPADSLGSRLAAIAGDTQLALLRSCASQEDTWERAAEVLGKPVRSVGHAVVRAAERLSRYFGAPPLFDPDFLSALPKNGGAKGRVVSMNLDTVFYTATPEMRTIGLSIPSEIRTATLWNTARSPTAPQGPLADHLAQCHYCSDVLRAMLRLQKAILSGPEAGFLFCPAASTLVQDTDDTAAIARHLTLCPSCRKERDQVLEIDEPASREEDKGGASKGNSYKPLWIVVAALTAIVIGWAVLRTRSQPAVPPPLALSDTSKPLPQVSPNPRFGDLVQAVNLDDPKLIATAAPSNQIWVTEALGYMKRRQLAEAKLTFSHLMNRTNDPGARMLYAICLFGEQAFSESYDEMKKAEAIQPPNAYRCWSTLQMALRFGDKETADREIAHLASDPDFGLRAKGIQAKMANRK